VRIDFLQLDAAIGIFDVRADHGRRVVRRRRPFAQPKSIDVVSREIDHQRADVEGSFVVDGVDVAIELVGLHQAEDVVGLRPKDEAAIPSFFQAHTQDRLRLA